MFHLAIPVGEIHTICNWVVANAAARTALSLVAGDVGKVCLQIDTATPYMLTNNVGPVWVALGGAASMSNPMTTLKDIVIGGTVGGGIAAPVRLGKGSARQHLRVNYANNDLEYGTDDTVTVIGAPSAGVITLNASAGDYFTHQLSANVTSLVISNLAPAGRGATKMVLITQDATTARTFTWPTSFRWEGAPPTVSSALGAKDLLAITTFNDGTTWDATLSKGRA